jgi:hypothetical protein
MFHLPRGRRMPIRPENLDKSGQHCKNQQWWHYIEYLFYTFLAEFQLYYIPFCLQIYHLIRKQAIVPPMEWQLDNWPCTVNNQKYSKQRRFIQMQRKDDKMFRVCSATYMYSTQLSARNRVRYCQEQTERCLEVSVFQRPNTKSLTWDKVDSGIGLESTLAYRVAQYAHGKCVGVESGVDIRWGYSQLRHRVPLPIWAQYFYLWNNALWEVAKLNRVMLTVPPLRLYLCNVRLLYIRVQRFWNFWDNWEPRNGNGWTALVILTD